ncbi:hypothetical protein PVAP13_4KG177300 [Panicum virgatum]|uniref:Uncharacterized protein n=1 Tax=Panicum virgatum TaxID=38727 RepID=A0A8T0TKR6_PANVG|nr:hypothetical protein PVAP13_4KG177300 [Panicum virgatum]
MASHFLLVVLVASILHVAYATTSTTSVNLTAAATTTAYDSYTLNPEGKFGVTLPRECDFPITFGGQEFRFATTVGGVYGVRVQIKFGWLGLRQVDRAGDQLTLQVQQFTQSFPASAFSVSPSCS